MKLDDIRAAAHAKYGDFLVEWEVPSEDPDEAPRSMSVKLVNAMRLPKTKRDQLQGLESRLKDSDEDEAEVMRDMIRLVAKTEGGARHLLDAVGDDLTVLAEIVENYSKRTKVGEASGSHS